MCIYSVYMKFGKNAFEEGYLLNDNGKEIFVG